MAKLVKHVDNSGYSFLVRVRNNTPVSRYGSGVYIGPPDLDELKPLLSEEKIKLLQGELVDAQLVNAQLIRGSGTKLFNTVRNVVGNDLARTVTKLVKSIYQRDYYEGENYV